MSSLSEKMISEFVESTTPAKEERSHEFTINGTVTSVDHNGVANVMLDGGDETPCQTTVGCSAGDRVIVSFKNREPVVTSNISKPTATLEEVNAKVVNAVNVFAQNGTFSGTLGAAKGTFTGTLSGATYVDASQNFTMDIGTYQDSWGSASPAFKIGGYINGNPGNEYLEVEITLYRVSGSSLPHLSISGTVKSNPTATEESNVNVGIDDFGINFYGSWYQNGSLKRVSSGIPWGYHP